MLLMISFTFFNMEDCSPSNAFKATFFISCKTSRAFLVSSSFKQFPSSNRFSRFSSWLKRLSITVSSLIDLWKQPTLRTRMKCSEPKCLPCPNYSWKNKLVLQFYLPFWLIDDCCQIFYDFINWFEGIQNTKRWYFRKFSTC